MVNIPPYPHRFYPMEVRENADPYVRMVPRDNQVRARPVSATALPGKLPLTSSACRPHCESSNSHKPNDGSLYALIHGRNLTITRPFGTSSLQPELRHSQSLSFATKPRDCSQSNRNSS